MNPRPDNTSIPDFSQFVITAAELTRMPPEEIRRRSGNRRRPVWRHWYDPYAGPPVAQTVEEALANAASAKPGTVPEVEMLTPEEVEQRREAIRNRQPSAPPSRNSTLCKR